MEDREKCSRRISTSLSWMMMNGGMKRMWKMPELYAHQREALLDISCWKQPAPLPHQLTGVQALLRNKAFYLADEPRTGKSRQVVDAACMLREMNLIDLV